MLFMPGDCASIVCRFNADLLSDGRPTGNLLSGTAEEYLFGSLSLLL